MQKIVIWSLYLVLRLLKLTWSVRFFGLENIPAAANHHPKHVYAIGFWHEHILAGTLTHPGKQFSPLISASKDGDLASGVVSLLGYTPVRGSSTRGGQDALAGLIQATRNGFCLALSVDGPLGPRRICKSGIVKIASSEGVAIIPLGIAVNKAWRLKSWDRFEIPKPFARITIHYPSPIFVPSDLKPDAVEQYTARTTEALNAADNEAEKDFEHFNNGAKTLHVQR